MRPPFGAQHLKAFFVAGFYEKHDCLKWWMGIICSRRAYNALNKNRASSRRRRICLNKFIIVLLTRTLGSGNCVRKL